MAITQEIHVGDIGTLFKITIYELGAVLPVSSATVKQIIFKKPDKTTLTKTAQFYTDGSDGIITYTSVSGDLDLDGIWQIQAYLEFGTNKLHSDIETFRVHRNI